MPLDGIPALFATRCLCFGAASICAALAIAIPCALMLWPPHGLSGITVLLFLALVGLLVGSCALALRAGLRVGAWFRVDEQGMSFGEGPARGAERGSETRIEWKDVVIDPARTHDVGSELEGQIGRRGPMSNLVFLRRLPGGKEIVECRLPMRMTDNFTRCLWYRNRQELLVAVLAGLARQPGIRFTASVFVDAGVDPVTWRTMRRPRAALWAYTLGLFAVLWWEAGRAMSHHWSAGQIILVTVGTIAAWASISMKLWQRNYPQLTGVITFQHRPVA